MKIFLSWSGERSKRVAELLREWLPDVIQSLKPWFSADDIQRGALWLKAINDELAKTFVGVICLTQSNKNAPWILFEAGSLAKGNDDSRICTLLIDLKDSDLIKHPLTHFNHTKTDSTDLLKLLKTINSKLETPLEDAKLERAFDKYYPDFKQKLEKIIKETKDEEPAPKEANKEEILEEILRSVRNIERNQRNNDLSIIDEPGGEYRVQYKDPLTSRQLKWLLSSIPRDSENYTQFYKKVVEKIMNDIKMDNISFKDKEGDDEENAVPA